MSLYLGTTPIADGASTALLAGKADVDLSNITQTAKNNIIRCGLPDYSAGISITSGYSAIGMGFIFVSMDGASHDTNEILINNTRIAYSRCFNVYQEAPVMVQIPVDVGDTITWSGTSDVIAIYYPMKGDL